MFGKPRRETEASIRNILVVEDDALIAFDNEHVLGDAGFTIVATVDTAEAAVEAIGAGGIDLVLADVNLRGEGSGMDVARAARAAGMALLFVSGECPVDAHAYASGCLAKPYGPRDLLAAIAAIEARRAGRRTRRLPGSLKLFGD